jgi:hypothetical protein
LCERHGLSDAKAARGAVLRAERCLLKTALVIDSATALERPAAPSRLLAWLHVGDRAVLSALLVLHVAPLAIFPYLPTRDGPTHLEAAQILLRYRQPSEAALRQWFDLALPLAPNWLGHALLAAASLAMPPLVAEKALVAAFVVGLPLAARRALKAVRPDAGFLAVLVLPFTYTWLLHMGFYNFCLSLPVFFLAVASWLRDRATSRAGLLRLMGWATLLYFAHPVSLLLAAALLLTLSGWVGVLDVLEARRLRLSLRYAARQGARRLLRTALAFVPAAFLLLAWVWSRRHPAFVRFPLRRLLGELARLDVLVSFEAAETWPAAAVALGFLALFLLALTARARERRAQEGDAWFLGACVFLAVYLLAPVGLAGGSYVTPRLAVFPFFALLLWFGSMRWSAGARTAVAVASAAITTSSLALHARSYRDANDLLAEYLSAEPWLEAGTTVLPLHYRGEHAPPRVDVLAHAAAYLAVSRHTVDLVFYEGTGHGIFPVSFYRDVNPYRLLGDNPESTPACVDLEAYMERSGRVIDTILTWKRQRDPGTPCATFTTEQLHRRYRRVHESQPRRLLEVWRLKDPGP